MSRPTILVTNDDSLYSQGIKLLVEIAKEHGEVVVVAPNKPQSAMGHAITISKPLRLQEDPIFGDDVRAYACSGTPVDCVKLAVDKVLEKKPDLCLSGINHGSNASINVIYSGTMSAAMEAALEGINAIGFSSADYDPNGNMDACAKYVREVLALAMTEGFSKSRLLNVNIPNLPVEEVKGIKVCRQAIGKWSEEFDERMDPFNRKYYWLKGRFVNEDEKKEETDLYALENGYVSVVPILLDFTAHHEVTLLNEKWKTHV